MSSSILQSAHAPLGRCRRPAVFLNALEQVTQDASFKISSPVATDALQAAKQLLRWC